MAMKTIRCLLIGTLFCTVKSAIPCIDESINELDQEDPKLIKYIQDKLLSPPPLSRNLPEDLNLTDFHNGNTFYSGLQGQYGQPLFLEKLFKPLMESGEKRFFIEAGSYDGLIGTNTLRMELDERWTGLLVEPNPKHYELTKLRHRNAWVTPACFSTKTHPEIVHFDAAESLGGIINEDNDRKPGDGLRGAKERKTLTLQCVPFYSVIQALGKNQKVSYLKY